MGKQREDKPAGKGADNVIVSDFYKDILRLIEGARCTVALMVNAAITMLYWQIGKRINEEILKGRRAKYGEEIVSSLSRQLSWSHFKEIIYIDDSLKREFYAEMCRVEQWSVRSLHWNFLFWNLVQDSPLLPLGTSR